MAEGGIQTSRSAPATLHDVAREAGVSLATASRSLNGSTRKVNEEYRKRVLAAAARLDYSPNLSAQAVARGTTTTVALLVADIADPYFSSIAAGVVAEADTARLIVTMAATERDHDRELELVRTLRGQRPRVMILAGSRPTTDPTEGALGEELRAYERSGGMVVLISRNFFITQVSSIQLLLLLAFPAGFAMGSVAPIINTYLIQTLPGNKKGLANALYFSALDIGYGIGSVIWGVIAMKMGYVQVFYAASMLQGAAILMTVLQMKVLNKNSPAVVMAVGKHGNSEGSSL